MILKYPLRTEKAIRLIETDNVITFAVERNSNKSEIRKEIEKKFNVKVLDINTEIRGKMKISYIRLKQENLAIDLATKLGLI
jgi:ribosomal protein L23